MYMEPQTAVAKWDEGGVIQVSCTDIDPTTRQGCANDVLLKPCWWLAVHYLLLQAGCSA